MARPKYSENSITVKERIEQAFWSLLAEMPYENISIKALAAEAGINHNSIYYHFENIDALAKTAFQHVVLPNVGQLVRAYDFTNMAALRTLLMSQPDLYDRYRKLKLFAASNSLYLQNILKEGLLSTWLSASHLTPEELSSYERMELDVIFSVVISLIGKENDLKDLERLLQDDLGQAMMGTMRHILNK